MEGNGHTQPPSTPESHACYLPGFLGLNNLKNTDYVNVILQALAHVVPVRDFFLQPAKYEEKVR